jgi:uncharacterized protein (DUF305 family)
VLPTSEAPAGAGEPEAEVAPPTPGPGRWTRVLPAVVAVAALCGLAGIVGYVLGSGSPPGRGSTDVGFLLDMSVHHEQGVALANLELINGDTEGVQVFAREILRDQSWDLGLMQFQLGEWGYRREQAGPRAMQWMGMDVALEEMAGMATEDELELLRNARGRDADALFLTLMIEHHRGGVHMASYAADHAGDDDVRRLADRIARNQAKEIEELEAAGARYGLLRG